MDFACARPARLGGGNTSEILSQMGGCHELQLHDVTFCARRRTTHRLENTVRDSTDLDSTLLHHVSLIQDCTMRLSLAASFIATWCLLITMVDETAAFGVVGRPGSVATLLSHGRIGSSRQHVTSSSVSEAVDTTNSDDNDNDASPWWQSVELPHAYVAAQTRPDFPILTTTLGTNNDKTTPLVYLDSAATSQKPQYVLDKLDEYYQKTNSNVHRGAHTLSRAATAAYEASRDTVATFVGAYSRNEIVFTKGATEAINLVAYSYGQANIMGPDDEIIVTEAEHHANIVPWQILAANKGATIKYVHINKETGMIDTDELLSLLSPRTKIVAIQHVSNVLASVLPVREVVEQVREKSPDAKVVLDACQSVPHMKVDVKELGVDFLAASGHKLCAPTGIAFLWGREDLLNAMPPFLSGREMIDTVTLEGSTYAPAPGRFEAGTPAIAQAIGMGAAIDYLNKIGMDDIEAYEHELADYLYKRLSECEGITVFGPTENRAALCSFHCDNVHPSDLSSFLDIEGVAVRAGHHCCQPLHTALGYSHSTRASLYFYNTKE